MYFIELLAFASLILLVICIKYKLAINKLNNPPLIGYRMWWCKFVEGTNYLLIGTDKWINSKNDVHGFKRQIYLEADSKMSQGDLKKLAYDFYKFNLGDNYVNLQEETPTVVGKLIETPLHPYGKKAFWVRSH